MKKENIMVLHVWTNSDHTAILALLAVFGTLFRLRLMNIFLTQFWTVKLFVHKPTSSPPSFLTVDSLVKKKSMKNGGK